METRITQLLQDHLRWVFGPDVYPLPQKKGPSKVIPFPRRKPK